MKSTKKRVDRVGRQAFTLIELMVVVSIIGILISGVFMLMKAAGTNAKRAQTVARMERLQNAISGFYAEYGTYPPVEQHGSPDPWAADLENDFGVKLSKKSLTAAAAIQAARSQPLAFEFPNVTSLDEYINIHFKDMKVVSVNTAFAGDLPSSIQKETWQEIKMFKFGLMSFLLPRIEVIGVNGDKNSADERNMQFYASRQWRRGNSVKYDKNDSNTSVAALRGQRDKENRAVARWLPNFEKIVRGGRSLLGIDTSDPEHGFPLFRTNGQTGYATGSSGSGARYLLLTMTVMDGWDNEYYYYSAPPYQSYRIWSSGPDGKTFPPWISLDSLSAKERALAAGWTADDIARFDR